MRTNYLQIVAAIGVAGLVGACSSGAADKKVVALGDVSVGAMTDYAAGTTFKATSPMTFPILYSDHPNYPVKADWLLWQKMTELTNVTLDRTIVRSAAGRRKVLPLARLAPGVLA